jgi:hypothetical protein
MGIGLAGSRKDHVFAETQRITNEGGEHLPAEGTETGGVVAGIGSKGGDRLSGIG